MPEILSQDEINALLSALTGESVGGEQVQKAPEETGSRIVKPYDFRRPDKFSKLQLRTLQFMHETFARHVSTALSAYLRAPLKVSLTLVEQLTFDQFILSLPVPSVIGVIDMAPLDGKAVLEINPMIIFSMLDRLLGGAGRAVEDEKARELTDVEEVLARKIFSRIIEAFVGTWQGVVAFDANLELIETNPQFVQVMSPGDTVTAMAFDVSLGEVASTMSLCLSYMTLQPVLPRLSAQQWFTEGRKGDGKQRQDVIRRKLELVRLPVSAVVGHTELTVREVLDLKPGDIIKLGVKASEDIEVQIASAPRFRARPGVMGRRLAVEITRAVENEGGNMR
ncbi:MAG TPA: flagellar motor switch protein FliM [Firmicutes bacterium]|nr:flagellar motor switch protein FliM [Bacillota bacterium]